MAAFDKAQKKLLGIMILAAVFDGLTQGVLLLQESIARKALGASDTQIALIGVITNGAMLFSFLVSYFFAHRNKKWLVAAGYIAGRGIFALAFLITNSWVFLGFLVFYQGVFAIQIPVMNSFFQNRMGKNRGFAFGITRTVLILFTMLSSLAVGKLLDARPGSYVTLLSVIAVTGLATYAILFWVEAGIPYEPSPKPRAADLWKSAAEISRNRPFVLFELAFMVYGLGFTLIIPAVPVYLLGTLHFSYAQMSLAQGLFAQGAILVLTPIAGRIFDRIDIWVAATFSFGILLFYPLCFFLSYLFASPALAYLGYFFSSLGLVGVNFLWNLGTMHFSGKPSESYLYQGFHISLAGIRGVAGPLLGLLILSTIGVQWNFGISMVLFALSSLLSLSMVRRGRAAS